jgi:hypothetical protein
VIKVIEVAAKITRRLAGIFPTEMFNSLIKDAMKSGKPVGLHPKMTTVPSWSRC